MDNGKARIRFGAFEVDFYTGEVHKGGSRLKLQEQPFKVLQVLLENAGQLVTREQLKSRIWASESFGDFDHAVNVAVAKLRTALGDAADNPSYIETVPRRGYRFVAALDKPPPPAPDAGAPAALHDAAPPGAPTAAANGATGATGATSPTAASGAIAVGATATPSASAAAGGARPAAATRGHRRALQATVAIGAAVVLVGLGAMLGRRTAAPWRPPDFQRLTSRRGTVYAARFAPDGRNVIYAAAWGGAPIEIFSTDPAFMGTQSLGLPATDLLAVSPAGVMAVLQPAERRFMFTVRGTLGQVPQSGGSPRQIAERVDWADWAPQGTALAVVREAAGRQRLEFPLGHVLYESSGWLSHPRISPRGDQVAFLDHPAYPDDGGSLQLVDLAGHKQALSTGWESVQGVAWAPDGRKVWFSATHSGLERRIYAVDLATGRESLQLRAPGGITLQDIAADGRLLLTRDDQRVGIQALPRGASAERDLSWKDWSIPADLSPDGATLLFDEQGAEAGPTYTAAVRDLQGSPPTPLGEGLAGALSPDGRWATSIRANSQILLLPTGAGAARQLVKGDVQHYWHGARWLPDGRRIVFSANQPGHATRCFVQSVDGGPPHPVTPEGFARCQVSPDGRTVAGDDPAGGVAWLFALDGSERRPIPGLQPGEEILWTADSHFLYAYRARQTPVKVYRLDVANGQRQLFRVLSPPEGTGPGDIAHVLFSADGQVYAYGYTRLLSELYLVKGLQPDAAAPAGAADRS